MDPMDALPNYYPGRNALILRVDMGRRKVRAIVSQEALEERFGSARTPQAWIEAYRAHAATIDALVRSKVQRACPEPIVISMHDFAPDAPDQRQAA